jgi:hypothetical protein
VGIHEPAGLLHLGMLVERVENESLDTVLTGMDMRRENLHQCSSASLFLGVVISPRVECVLQLPSCDRLGMSDRNELLALGFLLKLLQYAEGAS